MNYCNYTYNNVGSLTVLAALSQLIQRVLVGRGKKGQRNDQKRSGEHLGSMQVDLMQNGRAGAFLYEICWFIGV